MVKLKLRFQFFLTKIEFKRPWKIIKAILEQS